MPDPSQTVVGWREWVSLPQAGVDWIKAKVDTGARTSAIHAFDQEEFERNGEPWIRFSVHPWQATDEDAATVERPLVELRTVRSSSGHTEDRPLVHLDLILAGRAVTAEVTLSRRDEMGFRMLVGREALAQGFLVDPALSYAGRRPRLAVRRRNRGR